VNKLYVLKHKNIPVVTFYLNDKTFEFSDLGDILDYDRLPYGIEDKKNRIQNGIQLNTWIKRRGIPDSRKDMHYIKKFFNVEDLSVLTIQARGLNLTDHYWIHEGDKNIKWEDVNYFDNIFDKVKPETNIFPGIDDSVARQSPNVCVDGSIEKRWIIKDGERYLIKGSRHSIMQEPFNEIIASMILDLFNIDHVHYNLNRTGDNIPYCECRCMVNRDIEYLNAQWVINQGNSEEKDNYVKFINICKSNNIKDVKDRMDEMMGLDFLIGNEDRHYGNFGILRNADTLEWLRMVPIFDNGNSLFFDRSNEELDNCGIDSLCKAFGNSNRLNLELLHYPEWYDKTKSDNIINIIKQGLSYNEKLLINRIDRIVDITKERLKIFNKMIDKKEK